MLPFLTFLGLWYGGLYIYLTLIFAFIFIPIVEGILPPNHENDLEDVAKSKATTGIFNFLLYLNLPIVLGLILLLALNVKDALFEPYVLIIQAITLGVTLSACAINVAHELGHRKSALAQLAAKTLLLTCGYQHFFIEHNRGHHKHVGTLQDPATARINENLYAFFFRSLFLGYLNAWKLERTRLQRANKSNISLKNEMIRFTISQILFYFLFGYLFGTLALIYLIGVGALAVFLLEDINYIEHYGLSRKTLNNGQLERMDVQHSWNSNHVMGRIMLYELTRHSDHHYNTTKPYQTLLNHERAPQLPFGYPSSLLLALLPPLWFRVMNKRLPEH